jgi:hypothetical protein
MSNNYLIYAKILGKISKEIDGRKKCFLKKTGRKNNPGNLVEPWFSF